MSPRIQRMKITLLPYTFTAEHVKGTTLKDANALEHQQNNWVMKDQIAKQEIIIQVNSVVQTMPATDKKLNGILHLTKYDQELQQSEEVMQKGWPSSIKDCPELAQPYFTSRHDISELDEIVCKGRQIIIPQITRPNVLKPIHARHQSIKKCKRWASDCCYWPNMNQQIESVVKKFVQDLPPQSQQKCSNHILYLHNHGRK